MKLVSKTVSVESVVLELKPKELGTLVAAFGVTGSDDRRYHSSIPADMQLETREGHEFYREIYELFKEIIGEEQARRLRL